MKTIEPMRLLELGLDGGYLIHAEAEYEGNGMGQPRQVFCSEKSPDFASAERWLLERTNQFCTSKRIVLTQVDADASKYRV